jgi:5-methylcytosine-specific restriction endonuclease McrA
MTKNKELFTIKEKYICPYSGKEFLKASDLDIDHVVSLSDAHRSGGAAWTREQRRTFANDADSLLCGHDKINISKSDKGPDEWRPPNKAYLSAYTKNYKSIKNRYGLIITRAEAKALKEMLN